MIGYALELALETFPLFALAIVVGSLLDHYLPQSIYKFGEKKDLVSVLIAALMGSLIPLCTCGMI